MFHLRTHLFFLNVTKFDVTYLKINGFKSKSPLVNNATTSSEIAEKDDGTVAYLNLFEIMLPDISNFQGNLSSIQVYTNMLRSLGLDVSGVHYNWSATSPFMVTVNHQNIVGMYL